MAEDDWDEKADLPQTDRAKIRTNFLAHQAAEASSAQFSSVPGKVVLLLILFGVAYGVWQVSNYFMDYGRLNAIKNCYVTLKNPRAKGDNAYVDVLIENNNPQDIANPVIKYQIYGPTNNTISIGQIKIAGSVPAGDERTFPEISLGKVNSQSGSMLAELLDMSVGTKVDLSDELKRKFIDAAQLPDKDAVVPFEAFVHQAPRFAPGFIGLGEALAANNKLDQAITAYKEAIALDDNDADAHYNLAIALYYRNNKVQAKAEIKRAHELRADDLAISETYKQMFGQ